MKVKVYHDTRKEHRDCEDSWSVLFTFPKILEADRWKRQIYLGCSPWGEDGIIKCTWGEVSSPDVYLGKRMRGADIPEGIARFVSHAQAVFDNLCTDPDNKEYQTAWENL